MPVPVSYTHLNVGYCMNIDGKIFSFLTDLGHITPTAAEYICKANYLVLEANYDDEMLKMGPYPQYLKERIAGPNGHMSCLLYTSRCV